jgi:antitoxin (DNA-binding transcriptional repressor) of toxin-antitoxin stability system
MIEMTVTDFARNLRKIFDRIVHQREEIVLLRNKQRIARIIPGTSNLTAREAMGDLYRTIPEDAAKAWVEEGRVEGTIDEEVENKWDT